MEANDFQKPYQDELDRLQAKLMPEIEAERGAAIAYCNACINSGIGALKAHLIAVGKPEIAELAIAGVLHTWLAIVNANAAAGVEAKE